MTVYKSNMNMDKLILGVLYISGKFNCSNSNSDCFSFSTCHFYQYHYISSLMIYSDAQTYCRQTYTDLATIESREEINKIISMVFFLGYSSDVWIGVYFDLNSLLSQTITPTFWDWENSSLTQPYFVYYLCGYITTTSPNLQNCSVKHPFICDTGEHTAMYFLPIVLASLYVQQMLSTLCIYST